MLKIVEYLTKEFANVINHQSIFAVLLIFWAIGAIAQDEPTQVQEGLEDISPYNSLGLIFSLGRGTGFVFDSPGIVLSAAHVFYFCDGERWTSNDLIFHPRQNSEIPEGPSTILRGAYFQSSYADAYEQLRLADKSNPLIGCSSSTYDTFDRDFAVFWTYGDILPQSERLTLSADAASSLTSSSRKTILGYPAHNDDFFMYETGPNITAWDSVGNSVYVSDNFRSFGGNSGGPILVEEGGSWQVAGVVVGGRDFFGTGLLANVIVKAIEQDERNLIATIAGERRIGIGGSLFGVNPLQTPVELRLVRPDGSERTVMAEDTQYSFLDILPGFTGELVPRGAQHRMIFDPPSRFFSGLDISLLNQDFTASLVAFELNSSQAEAPIESEVELVLSMRNDDGSALPNEQIHFSSGYSGEFTGCSQTPSGCSTLTDANGQASVHFRSGVAGIATISATHGNAGSVSTEVEFVRLSGVVNATPNPVEVAFASVLSADFGAIGTGESVSFSTDFPGLFSPGNTSGSVTVSADQAGVATAEFVPSAAGTAIITIQSVSSDPQSIALVVNDPNATQSLSLSARYSSGNSSSTTYVIDAFVQNEFGDPVSGEPVDFSLTGGNAQVNDSRDITGTTGRASTTVTVFATGPVSVRGHTSATSKILAFNAQIGTPQVAEMTPARSFALNSREVFGVDYSPDGASLYAAADSGRIIGWRTSDYSTKFSFESTDNDLGQLAVTPDSQYFQVGSDDEINIYSSSGSRLCRLNLAAGDAGMLGAWASNSIRFITNSSQIRRSSTRCGSIGNTSAQPPVDQGFESRSRMDFSTARGLGAVATDRGQLVIFNSSGSLSRYQTLSAAGNNGHDVDFSEDGSRLAAVGIQSAAVFDTSSWTRIASPSSPTFVSRLVSVALIDNGSKVAIGMNGRVEIYDLSAGSSTRFANVSGEAVEMDWNPLTEELAVGTSNSIVYIFEPLAPIISDVVAPTISVSTPDDGLITNLEQIVTNGLVTDDVGVTEFLVNGVPIAVTNNSFSTTISLSEGENGITYLARDASGKSSQIVKTVTRLVDRTSPAVNDISVSPSRGRPGELFVISAAVVDSSGISSVRLDLQDTGGAALGSVSLGPVGADIFSGVFDSTGTMPAFLIGNLHATDASAQSNTTLIENAIGFEVFANQPPIQPFSPSPGDGATEVRSDTGFSWGGGDPDGDIVSYQVWLRPSAQNSFLGCESVDLRSCQPGSPLESGTSYSWWVSATDTFGDVSQSSEWVFSTEETPAPDLISRIIDVERTSTVPSAYRVDLVIANQGSLSSTGGVIATLRLSDDQVVDENDVLLEAFSETDLASGDDVIISSTQTISEIGEVWVGGCASTVGEINISNNCSSGYRIDTDLLLSDGFE